LNCEHLQTTFELQGLMYVKINCATQTTEGGSMDVSIAWCQCSLLSACCCISFHAD